MTRQPTVPLLAFAAGTALGAILGADSFGIALGIGQLTFAAALLYVLLRE